VARDFPSITDLSSALRFALEAELAGADFAAAAEVIAPDEPWREKLEELTCAHDDRLQKLRKAAEQLDGAPASGLSGFDATALARDLGAEPATGWPAAAEQLASVEDAIAAYHEALVGTAAEALGDKAHLFTKSAEQARAAAQELRSRLV
jgi:rubrerythrin